MRTRTPVTYSPRLTDNLAKPYKKQRLPPSLVFIIGLLFSFFIGIDLKICREMPFMMRGCISNNGTDDVNEKVVSKEDPPVNLKLIGILTAKQFLNTRVMAINETWAETIHGKVLFFSGENSTLEINRYQSLISLPGVTDAYPPQKKSSMVLKYMHDFHLDQYEWFILADDDVYIVGDKLANFLASVNSSKVFYIDHSEQETKNEKGKLGLFENILYGRSRSYNKQSYIGEDGSTYQLLFTECSLQP